ncbi:MAG TPA: S46 family peptidase [Bacteroidales bacterium]|nr:S46 family peptidase [Bacteroidales bacterium]HPK39331.1 S46 family peptidase [Bacteroidales bacterium]
MKKILLYAIPLFLVFTPLRADEGMWPVHLLEKNLVRQMQKKGMKIKPDIIYDNERTTLSSAVVSMDFGCTGSIISDNGLLITNHHCAYSDIHAFSTPGKNYLEEGFWARNVSEEKPVPEKMSISFAKYLI